MKKSELRQIIISELKYILKEEKPCWKSYKQYGMKKKNGKEVPNCVPEAIQKIKENKNMVNIKSFSNHIDGKVVGSRTKLKPKIKGDLIVLPVEVFGEKLNVTLEIKPGKMDVYMHKPNEKYNSNGPKRFVYRNMSEKSLWDDLRYNYFEL